eukprot:1159023-Pelagomonas_calceolata.AAC.5
MQQQEDQEREEQSAEDEDEDEDAQEEGDAMAERSEAHREASTSALLDKITSRARVQVGAFMHGAQALPQAFSAARRVACKGIQAWNV